MTRESEASRPKTDQEKSRLAEPAALQHRLLRRLLSDLGGSLRAPAEPPGLSERFAHFCTVLEQHFSFEEEGGYFEVALSAAPWLAPDAERLFCQHAAFRTELRRLEALVAADRSGRRRQDLEVAFARFRGRLEEHENQENSLLQRAFGRDMAAAD